jgi:hypothetical protein
MRDFDVKVGVYDDEPAPYPWSAATAREAAINVLAELDDIEADYLTVVVEPTHPDEPESLVVGEPDPWEGVSVQEVAVNRHTGEVRRWDPDVLARKGGLATPWVWLAELSPFETFELVYLRQGRGA